MDPSTVGRSSGALTFPTRRAATAHAKAAIVRSDLQKRLADEAGAFVWKVEKYPNWLQISVDMLGNAEPEERTARDNLKGWFDKERQAQINEMFQELLGEPFGELYITAQPMGLDSPNGHCCRTGCGGCLNGTRDKLLDKLQPPAPSLPTDSYG
jgi:hypothetical protein